MVQRWTEQEIREFLQNEQLGYQKIRLPFDLSTSGTDRKLTCDLIFGNDLRGKTVLDVGSYLGYFCLQALERGAGRAVGWEVSPESVRQARAIAEMLDSPAEYYERDFEKGVLTNETFDVVLCLNVLHHLSDPVGALEKLIQLTRDTLILEVASLGGHDSRKLGISSWLGRFLDKMPVIFVARGATTPPYDKQDKFYFTRSALTNLLQYQRSHFAQVKFIDSEFKNRFIVIARRRRVKHLVVIAGPTSAGKTTLIKELVSNKYPELGAKLGISDFRHLPVISARSLTGAESLHEPASEALLDGAVFHYDFMRPYGRSTRTLERDEVLDILCGADEISFVTLWTPPDRLKQQIERGELQAPQPRNFSQRIKSEIRERIPASVKFWVSDLPLMGNLIRKVGGRHLTWFPDRRHSKIIKLYQNPEQIVGLYSSWFKFTDGQNYKVRSHLVIECSNDLKIYSRQEWDRIADKYIDHSERPASYV